MLNKCLLFSAAFALLGAVPAFAGGPSFHPDVTFQGSSLDGWHTVGQASWHAENGEVIGSPQSSDGGWLMLDCRDNCSACASAFVCDFKPLFAENI